jgi:hypothetical protein
MRRRQRQRGSIVEFLLAGITSISIIISTVQLGLAMWNYHTLAEAVHETNRYISSHGRTCVTGGNHCGITLDDIVTKFQNNSVGLPSGSVNLTLTSETGVVQTCSPMSSCVGNTTQWPPSDHFDNSPGRYIKLQGDLTVNSAIVVLWFGLSGQQISTIRLPAISRVPIVF